MSSSLKSFTAKRKIRRSFSKINKIIDMPNLIEVQRQSYKSFLQMYTDPSDRKDVGLEAVFRSVFPINDFADRANLNYVSYTLEKPKYDVEECQQRGLTFASALRITLRLEVWDIDETTEAKTLRDIKEQDVYMGDIPLMTKNGTFVVNGTERVIVSQMHRSPGVFFDHDRGKTHASGKFLFAARVIPYRGSWLDFEFDTKDILNVRIDRRRKLPATTLLMALLSPESKEYIENFSADNFIEDRSKIFGSSPESILNHFYNKDTYIRDKSGWKTEFNPERMRPSKLSRDLIDADTNKVLLKAGERLSPRSLKKLSESGLKFIRVLEEELIDKYIASDLINLSTGAVIIEAGDQINEDNLSSIKSQNYNEIELLFIDNVHVGPWIRNTLSVDKNSNRDDALIDIYRVMRPGEPPTIEAAETLFKGLFFDSDRYDLSSVGRVKMNNRLNLKTSDDLRILQREDIFEIVRVLIGLKDGKGDIDDIDHLGNRRVRSVGELMENQYRVGLLRMERAVKERMGSVEIDTVMPHDLINSKPAAAAVREFFGSSQLSQFMDQTNPLSEITHKRRVSALGPGGLTRERAGFEVRDVHPTHYGRICPIETPEGPNIGLINSLATHAKINQYGFIETPYRKVINGKVTNNVEYISAMEESRYTIAQANAELKKDGTFIGELIPVRTAGEIGLAKPDNIDLMDVSPKQLVSVAAALIPFLENDDANRALMGSNMQRQAVPLLVSNSPFVGTGMEEVVARDSGVAIVANRSGIIDQVDATRIVVRADNEDDNSEISPVDIYSLLKFQRSNQNTCVNQRPLVKVGDFVEKGDIIADGPSTDDGELALGKNVLVAYMPWNGYNFEDSILISERIVHDDVFTSIHIEEFEIMARDTKLGQEEITRDIPNVGEETLKDLDEAGIVYVGAEVKSGDVLVGKVTPKGESPMTPEEKLLRAIFGEKASDVRDTSLRLPPGASGTVVEVRIFSRRGLEKDERARAIERQDIERLAKDRDDEQVIIERAYNNRLKEILIGNTLSSDYKEFKKGYKIDDEFCNSLNKSDWSKLSINDENAQQKVEYLGDHFDNALKNLELDFSDKVEKLQSGDELLPGVMKMIKVFVAVKRKLQAGDKMAGRHGNKGVISRIMPVEDMPYLDDGTPIDVVLNPLGVPSRMNVGQVLETHLGWAAYGIGKKIAEASILAKENSDLSKIKDILKKTYNDEQFKLIDKMNDKDLLNMAEKLKNGIPMGTDVFDGAREADIKKLLSIAGLSETGQEYLTDGRTGERFSRPVTVGYKYILKLHHLVDDKIHARSIGPYSLVTQQPLGGKAQFGGQRFGEMEVWALQAYGAAFTLQEMLTVKSDDVSGRTKVYESIVRGDDNFETGVPESFNVLVKELKSLGLNVDMNSTEN